MLLSLTIIIKLNNYFYDENTSNWDDWNSGWLLYIQIELKILAYWTQTSSIFSPVRLK